MIKVSVIIPCYNQGTYLDEAVQSVLDQTFTYYEIVIINDGSTDSYTNDLIDSYSNPKIKVLTTTNQGLAAARNNGIKEASGEYILPLDADDKIGTVYLEKAVKVLDENPQIGIVYCEAEYFGDQVGKWCLPNYSYERILIENVIFCTAFFRKESWQKAGGYNLNMKYGYEDWDFWLSIISMGGEVYKIPEVMFFYRIRTNSMIQDLDIKKRNLFQMFMQVIFNHQELYLEHLEILNALIQMIIQKCKSMGFIYSIYIDTGQDYNEKEKIRSFSSLSDTDEFNISISLKGYNWIKQLRFDPLEGYWIEAKINNIKYLTTTNEMKELDVSEVSSNGTFLEDGRTLFQTFDPMFFLPIAGELEKISISGEMRILESQQIEQLIDEKEHVLKRSIQEKEQALEEKEQVIASVEQALEEKEQVIASVEQALEEKEQVIASVEQALEEKEQVIASVEQALEEKEQVIDSLLQKIEKLQYIVHTQPHVIERKNQEIEAILNSKSWRITAPLRKISSWFKELIDN